MNNPYMESKYANIYDAAVTKYPIIKTLRVQEKNILIKLFKKHLKNNDIVLEIGAGTGYYSLNIAKQVRKLTAIEPSKEMINIMKKKIDDENIKNIEIIEDGFLQYKTTKKFDKVICCGVLDFIDKPKEFIEKCLSMTKTNGTVIFTIPNKSLFYGIYEISFRLQNSKVYNSSEKQIKKWFGKYNVDVYNAGFKTKINKGLILIVVIEKRLIDG